MTRDGARTILAINPGSTSTKVAVFAIEGDGLKLLLDEEVRHPKEELAAFASVAAQKDFRAEAIRSALAAQSGGAAGPYAAVVGRGGLLRPIPGGVYAIGEAMLDDLASERYGSHPCNLGAPLALDFAAEWGCPAVIVDPPVTDELDEAARLTGLPEVRRRSVFHALSQRGAARTAARRLGIRYEEAGFIVAHLGGGISIGAHRAGRVVEVLNALDGEGPFSPERAGRLPVLPLLAMLEQGETTIDELRARILTRGGLFAHLGSNDLREIEARIDGKDKQAALVFEALARGIARDVSSLAPLFAQTDSGPCGGLDLHAVVVTGGMARSLRLQATLRERLSFLAPVITVTGLEEMQALADGARLALAGEVPVQVYLA